MKTRTKIVREGERMGDIDWSYPFREHFNVHCCNDAQKQVLCDEAKHKLELVEKSHNEGKEVWIDTGVVFQLLLSTGMYEGWPYWKPVPSICVKGTLGAEWHDFTYIKQFKQKDPLL